MQPGTKWPTDLYRSAARVLRTTVLDHKERECWVNQKSLLSCRETFMKSRRTVWSHVITPENVTFITRLHNMHLCRNSCQTIVTFKHFCIYGNLRSKYSSPLMDLSLKSSFYSPVWSSHGDRITASDGSRKSFFIWLWKTATRGEDILCCLHLSHFQFLQNGNQIDSFTIKGMQYKCTCLLH